MHTQPMLRAREEAAEAAGINQTLDSGGVTVQKALEAAGIVVKQVPACLNIIFNNTSYAPSSAGGVVV